MMLRTLVLVTLFAAVLAEPIYWERSWNIRRAADAWPATCCEKKDAFCDARDKASCEALNDCADHETGIACETESGEPRTRLFDYICASKDPCQDKLDAWCDDAFETDTCLAYAKCVLENVLEDEDDVDVDDKDTQDVYCSSGNIEVLWYTSTHACGVNVCQESMSAACAEDNEANCNAFVKCSDPSTEEYEYDEEEGCSACEFEFQLSLASSAWGPDDVKYINAMCEATTKEEVKVPCKEWATALEDRYDEEDVLDCDEVFEDGDYTVKDFQVELGCLCTKPFPWVVAAAGGAVALLVVVGVGAAVMCTGRTVNTDGESVASGSVVTEPGEPDSPPPPEYSEAEKTDA